MRIRMREEVGNSSVLAGAMSGRDALARLLTLVKVEPGAPEPLFLDFESIEAATASYLRESIVAFRHVIRERDSHYYPVIANPNNEVRDELAELARARREVFVTCALADAGAVSDLELVGDLEEKQKLTFELVRKHGETDAGELMRKYGDLEKVRHTTAWNNRLSALAALGLLIETRHGRLKRYRPLFEGP
jgi:hypothetical protein